MSDDFEENLGGGFGGEDIVDEDGGDGGEGSDVGGDDEEGGWEDKGRKGGDEGSDEDIGGHPGGEHEISEKADFKHLQQLSSDELCDRVGASGTQKYLRSPMDAALAQACGILSSKHDKLSRENKIQIVDRVRLMRDLPLLNMECLIAAEVWVQTKKKTGFKAYAEGNEVEQADLLRYIRKISM